MRQQRTGPQRSHANYASGAPGIAYVEHVPEGAAPCFRRSGVRVGIVGLGWAATGLHLPALRRLPEVEVVGGCDVSADQRARWQAETRLDAFAELDSLVERARPDVLVVATPPGSHARLCVEALDRGLHVVCEKPFAETLADADRVIAAAERAGRGVAVNHEFREKPIFKALERAIRDEAHGRLVFCQVWQLMDLPPWREPVPWRAEMKHRSLLEGGVHLVDLLLTLYGEVPVAVCAQHSSGLDAPLDADAIQLVTLEFPGGRLAQITIDRLCRAGTRYAEVRADCERASLRASVGGRAYLQLGKKRAERAGLRFELASGGVAWAEQGRRRRTLARNPKDAGVRATAALVQGAVAAFRAGREPPSSARQARVGLAVIEAAYRSAESGLRVELAPLLEATPTALSA